MVVALPSNYVIHHTFERLELEHRVVRIKSSKIMNSWILSGFRFCCPICSILLDPVAAPNNTRVKYATKLSLIYWIEKYLEK